MTSEPESPPQKKKSDLSGKNSVNQQLLFFSLFISKTKKQNLNKFFVKSEKINYLNAASEEEEM